jgi:hypothetical protein
MSHYGPGSCGEKVTKGNKKTRTAMKGKRR